MPAIKLSINKKNERFTTGSYHTHFPPIAFLRTISAAANRSVSQKSNLMENFLSVVCFSYSEKKEDVKGK